MKIKILTSSLTLGLLCVLLSSSVVAETKSLTVDEVVRATLDRSPMVSQIEARSLNLKADAFEAETLSNPSLDTEIGIPTAWKESKGDTEFSVSLTQPFKLSHGALRNRLAGLLKEVGDSEREQELFELVTKARTAYSRLWILSQREKILKDIQPKTKSLTQFVSSGLKQGAYGQSDEAVFRTEVAKNEAELLGIQAEQLAGEAELFRLTGQNFENRSLTDPGTLATIPVSTVETALNQGELRVQRRGKMLLELARADSAVAERDSFPELKPRISYSRTNEGVDLVGIGLSFDLPFYSQNTAERMRKTSQALSAEAQSAFFQGETFKSSVLKSVKMYELKRQELAIYENKVVPGIKEALNSFEKQVRGGQGSIFQLWQTSREYVEIQERYLELWSKAFSDYLELSILLGQEI